MKKIIAIALLAALTACTSMDELGLSEEKYQHAWVDRNVVRGKTSMENIRAIYGEPYKKSGNGLNDIWYYRSLKRSAGVALVDRAQGAIYNALPGGARRASGTAQEIGGRPVKDNESQELTFHFKGGFVRDYQ